MRESVSPSGPAEIVVRLNEVCSDGVCTTGDSETEMWIVAFSKTKWFWNGEKAQEACWGIRGARAVPRGFLESRASAAGQSPAQSNRSLQSITAELSVIHPEDGRARKLVCASSYNGNYGESTRFHLSDSCA